MDENYWNRKIIVEGETTNPLLASDKEKGEHDWIEGVNCVYQLRDGQERYRVAINTKTGWKAYGYFNDLGTASYVANIAILIEDSDFDYTLNEVPDKDSHELQQWRMKAGNQSKENVARQNFKQYQQRKLQKKKEKQKRDKEEKKMMELRFQREKVAQENEEKRRRAERLRKKLGEKEFLATLSTSKLLQLSEKRHLTGRQHRAIREVLDKRKAK